jgi:nicotinamide riboside kinase
MNFDPKVDHWMVGLVGAQGCGKTTLAELLSKRWGYPYFAEGVRPLLKKHGFSDENHGGEDQLKRTLALQWDVCEYKTKAWDYEYCVADRTQVDCLAYLSFWACRSSNPGCEDLFERVKDLVRAELELWDAVIVVPPNIPLIDDGVRSPMPYYREHIHYLMCGILSEFNYPHYILDESGIEERVLEVECVLSDIKRDSLA